MKRLVKSDVSAAGQRNGSGLAPVRGLDLGALSASGLEGSDFGVKIVAHQVQHSAEQLVAGVLLAEISIRGMDGGFCRRQAEDQPSCTDVQRTKSKNVAKEGSVGLGMGTVKKKMCTTKHGQSISGRMLGGLTNFAGFLRMKWDVTLR